MGVLLSAPAIAQSVLPAAAQVHYHPDGQPWKQRAAGGPDAEVDGWYYNLGITGLRVELVEEAPDQVEEAPDRVVAVCRSCLRA